MTTVYIARDAMGNPLYVGVTDRFELRMTAHRYGRWWRQKATVETEEWPDRTSAESRELDLIEELRPPFNGTDGRWRERDRALLALRLQGLTWVEAGAELKMSRNAIKNVRRRLQRTGQIARIR